MSCKNSRTVSRTEADRATIRQWVEMAKGDSGVRSDKIARVREAIRQGRYDVSRFLDKAIERLEDDMDTVLIRMSESGLTCA